MSEAGRRGRHRARPGLTDGTDPARRQGPMTEPTVTCRPGDAGWHCTVTLGPDAGATTHEVRSTARSLDDLAPGCTPEELVRASFEFLLEREPRETIMRSFELPIIGRFFADYRDEILRRLGRPNPPAGAGASRASRRPRSRSKPDGNTTRFHAPLAQLTARPSRLRRLPGTRREAWARARGPVSCPVTPRSSAHGSAAGRARAGRRRRATRAVCARRGDRSPHGSRPPLGPDGRRLQRRVERPRLAGAVVSRGGGRRPVGREGRRLDARSGDGRGR